ncbi:MAG: GNAT family N-acetyltransferase, partial [Luminiphilus sp.]|nr:GNAT family N-acetyltransferase [Luminiphilus sp.]
MLIRKAKVNDFQCIIDINASEEEKTSRIDLAKITQLNFWSDYHRVAVEGDQVVGFLLVMSDASDYDGDNFRWFVDRYSSFLYVDRIVIDQAHARRGVGSALYCDLIEFATRRG